MRKISGIAVLSGVLAFPIAAQAQGLSSADPGASDGKHRAAGPVGGIVGGIAGDVGRTIVGILGSGQAPNFRNNMAREQRPS